MPALLLTADLDDRTTGEIRRIAPQYDHVVLHADRLEGDLDDVRVAFVSEASPAIARRFADVLPACDRLEWLHSGGVGVDHPVMQDLLARGVRMTNSSGANATLIGQTAILHVLAHSRRFERWKDAQRRAAWEPHDVEDLDGKVLGVLGLGPIGMTVASVGTALGMRVVGLRRVPRGDEPCETWPLERFDELVPIVDYLVLALPAAPETRRILSAERIARLKPTAYVVNVARGALIDEAALIAALEQGRIAGAALDAFDVEPLPPESPLWRLPNVTVTPHCSGRNPVKHVRATELFVENLDRFVRGQPMVNEVPPMAAQPGAGA